MVVGQLLIQKNEVGPIPYNIMKNWFQTDHRPKCKK